jgi:hypothetical protein
MADLEPGASEKYQDARVMVEVMDKYTMGRLSPGPFELCKFMKMASHFREERRTVRDAFHAYAAIALFFETDAFLAEGGGTLFKDSLLLKQEERAKHLPERRTHMSNKSMPTEFWKEWDKIKKDNDRKADDFVEDIYPLEWRKAMRPVIIRRRSSPHLVQHHLYPLDVH